MKKLLLLLLCASAAFGVQTSTITIWNDTSEKAQIFWKNLEGEKFHAYLASSRYVSIQLPNF